MLNPLVSIIIPTFNRAHLIGETLDSILAQTYKNWECIIVDDGSTDDTDRVMNEFQINDTRIKYLHRPVEKPKGGNACRNTGLEIAQGDYIVFFDSDDLMTPDHVEIKVTAITLHSVDYVITKTKNLWDKKIPPHYYAFDRVQMTPYNYILHEINWLTLDVIIKREVIDNIFFNEKLQSGQEYNFFSKLLIKSTNYHFEDQDVSLRRQPEISIRKNLDSEYKIVRSDFIKEVETLNDLKANLEPQIKIALILRFIKVIYRYPLLGIGYRKLIRDELYKLIGLKYIYFDLMLGLKKIDKAYKIRNILIKELTAKLV